MDAKELKAKAYDLIRLKEEYQLKIQEVQDQLVAVNQEIVQAEQTPKEEPKAE